MHLPTYVPGSQRRLLGSEGCCQGCSQQEVWCMHAHAYRVPGHDASQVGADGVEAVLLDLGVLVHDEVGCVTLQGTSSAFKLRLFACACGLSDRAGHQVLGWRKRSLSKSVLPSHNGGLGRVTSLCGASLMDTAAQLGQLCPRQPCRTARQRARTGATAHTVTQKQTERRSAELLLD